MLQFTDIQKKLILKCFQEAESPKGINKESNCYLELLKLEIDYFSICIDNDDDVYLKGYESFNLLEIE